MATGHSINDMGAQPLRLRLGQSLPVSGDEAHRKIKLKQILERSYAGLFAPDLMTPGLTTRAKFVSRRRRFPVRRNHRIPSRFGESTGTNWGDDSSPTTAFTRCREFTSLRMTARKGYARRSG